MHEVVSFFSLYNAYFLIGLSALSLILIVYVIVLSRAIGRLGRRRNAKLAEGRVEEVLDHLAELSDNLSAMQNRLDKFGAGQSEHNAVLSCCLRNVGMVKFDAFDDVGGEQSFALALLDANRDGVILSGLYGRQDSRLYAKGIVNGEGERALSKEEKRALDKALS